MCNGHHREYVTCTIVGVKHVSNLNGELVVERSLRMREIGVRFPVGIDISR